MALTSGQAAPYALAPAVLSPLFAAFGARSRQGAYDTLVGDVRGAFGQGTAALDRFERSGMRLVNSQLADIASSTSANASSFVSRARRRTGGTFAGIAGAGARNAGAVNAGRLLSRTLPALGQQVSQGRASLASELARTLAALGPRPTMMGDITQALGSGLSSGADIFRLLTEGG